MPVPQLGVPHSYLMMSYQYKFQDEDQTKVKGSIKYVFQLTIEMANLYTLPFKMLDVMVFERSNIHSSRLHL